jgi:hypothetical protein
MPCNCGKRPKKLNNLDSLDHLKLASDVYVNLISKKTKEEYDDFDKQEVIATYKQLFPNQRMEVTLDQAIYSVSEAHSRFISK